MKIPKAGEGQFVLITANYDSGIIINNDNSFYLGKGEDYYLIVNNKQDAIELAKCKVMQNKGVEVLIYDGDGNFVDNYRPEQNNN